MENPLVSIILCTYNRAHMLPQTMDSIFAQQYEPVEIVVVDDGSTDDTKELMASYGDKIRYHWQENQGIAAARNTGCHLAKGEFIAFQDSDDLMPADRIVNLYKALLHYPTVIFATGDYEYLDAEGNLTGKRHRPINSQEQDKHILIEDGYAELLLSKIPVSPHTTLFRKYDGERIDWHDTQFTYACSDKDFYLRLSKLGPIVYVRKIVSYVRRGHTSIWSDTGRSLCSRLLLFEKHLKNIDSQQKVLQEKLKYRIQNTLIMIASNQSKSAKGNEDPILKSCINRGVSLLGFKHRIKYWWYLFVRFPIRNALKKNNNIFK